MADSPTEGTSFMPCRGLTITHAAAIDYARVANAAISTYRHDAVAI
jgi:hypothetical protein